MTCYHLTKKSHRLIGAVALAASVLWCGGAHAADLIPSSETLGTAEPKTLRDAVAFMGQVYGFDVVGLDRLGTEAPDWPATEASPPAILKRLLRSYGYVAELKAAEDPPDQRLPQRLLIVGSSEDRRTGPESPGHPVPSSLARDADGHHAMPSALSRSLDQLALSALGTPRPHRSTDGPSAHATALSGPGAGIASSSTDNGVPDLAALTSTARANLIGLVTKLQQACKGNGC
jgi:hypothetical protein